MNKELIDIYLSTERLNIPSGPRVKLNCVDGMFAEILGDVPKQYKVRFINKLTNIVQYETVLRNNHWAKTTTKYYVDWKVEVIDIERSTMFEYHLDLADKRVYIAIESKSLGDTLAWVPYVEEFRKKHGCIVICSTFWNQLFRDEYGKIDFVEPGTEVHNLTALYRIGLFYNADGGIDVTRHPRNPITLPLQQNATDILGLEYREILPKIKQPVVEEVNSKQVTIAIHSTAQAKYWNHATGWQEVVDWLKERGYTVKLLSQEEDGYMGNRNPIGVERFPNSPIASVIEEIKKSKAFIGISSGLSWLSWALETPTVMISGFTEPYNEMQDCIRISAPKGKCSGCWHRHRFNPGDWNWCPDHKGTTRQFECSKEITAQMVIQELEKML